MSIFEAYNLEWAGEKLVIPPDRVMCAIAVVEQHITLHELFEVMGRRKTVEMVRLAEAYAALLNFAGAEVSAEEVYASFFMSGDQASAIISAVRGLQMLMIPPASYKVTEGNGQDGPRKAAARSSKKPTRPRKAAARSSKKPTRPRAGR
ncbi:MAG: hypothetical protein ACK4MX_09515 [Thermaurantiacus sp.]